MPNELSIINLAETEFVCNVGDAQFSVLFLSYPIQSDKQTEEGKPMHTHDYYEAVFFKEGKAVFETAQNKHALKSGNVIVESPLCEHKYSGIESSRAYKLGFELRRTSAGMNMYDAFAAALSGLNYEIFNGGERAKMLFETIAECKGKKGEIYRLRAAFIQIFFMIYDRLAAGLPMAEGLGKDAAQRNVKDIIANTILFHYTTDVGVNEIAEQVYLSPRQINRICHSMYGRTFQEQKTFCRIEKAKRLLVETDYTALEICFECGFSSAGNFYAAFEKFAGVPPKKYRDANR